MNAYEAVQCKICAASRTWAGSIKATCGIFAVDCKQLVVKVEGRGERPPGRVNKPT